MDVIPGEIEAGGLFFLQAKNDAIAKTKTGIYFLMSIFLTLI
jgi:hypothetical protein